MTHGSDFAAILALARAGAVDHALRRFEALGALPDDPVALTVKGRLLKQLATRAQGEARSRLYRESAEAYRRSAALRPGTYPLINAATLARLGGDGAQAAELAGDVLRSIDAHPDEPETPYYRAATRAEALVLLGRHADARAELAEAIALAPRAWEDHATTLRQLALILEAQSEDARWLDACRPPRSLHFGGHMSFDPALPRRDDLDRTIADILDEEQVGFGYGALAAGADLIVAEALLARGAELHAILPGGPEAFAAVSVEPFGPGWKPRFDAALAGAETVRSIRPIGALPDRAMIGLADEIAMGAAAMNAARLESSAVQLLVPAPEDSSGAGVADKARSIWRGSGRRQRIVAAPREAAAPPAISRDAADERPALAVLAVATDPDATEPSLTQLRETIAAHPSPQVGPYWAGEAVLLAFERPADAAKMAVALARAGHRLGGHYLVAAQLHDPFSNAARLATAATAAAEAAAASTPPGSACVSEDFAAALAAAGAGRIGCDYVGELDVRDGGPPLGLYALR